MIAKLIFRALLPFEERGYREAFIEAVFVLTDKANWSKVHEYPM